MAKTNKKDADIHFPVIILAILLGLALIVIGLLLGEVNKSKMEKKQLAVFNDLAMSYISEIDVTDNEIDEFYSMTGYGISSEDNVFYITFTYADYSACTEESCVVEPKYGVVYFWPTEGDENVYSHAYSYHDEAYHPAGTYVEYHMGE